MPNKQLTANVRLNTTQAEQKLKNLAKAIDAINNSVNRQSNTYAKVNSALSRTANQTRKAKAETDKLASSANKVNTNFKKTGSLVGSLTKNLRTLISTYVGLMGAKAVLNTSDTITSAENKLNYLNGGNADNTQLTMDKTYAAAQRSRGNYTDMIGNVSKSMTLASGAFQDNVDNAIRFQEIMSKAYTIGGASAAEQSSSMYQLIQALGSGVLQGDELRSVREGAPLAYKEIEKFAQGVLKTDESLKKLASDGKITSDLVVAAVMDMGAGIDKAFEKTDMTFAQAWNNIKNMGVKAFEPVLQMLNDALNSDIGRAMIDGIGQAFVVIANAILWVMDLLGSFFNWCADNWNWLKYIVIGGLVVMIGYLIYYTATAIAGAVVRIAYWIAEHWQMLLIIATLVAMVATIVWWANTAASGCEFVCGALAIVALAIILIGIITGSTALLIIGIVVALAAIIIMYLDYVMGAVYATGAIIYNIGVGVLNGLIQAVYAIFVDPIAGVIEWFVNAFNGGFTGIVGAAANAVGQVVSMFLSGLKIITKAVDAVAGTSLTDKITGWQNSAKSWGKSENAVTYSVEAPTFQRKSVGDAWDAGFSKGTEWKNNIGEFGSTIQNKINGFTNSFSTGDFGTFSAGNNNLSSLLNPYDPAYGVDGNYDPSKALDSIGKGVGDVGDNTGKMADAMDLTQEDLEYLRKIADMEWKKEFTTANITVDMSNYNTINGDNDLDGIVTKLSDKLREEMNILADGVYE